MLAASKRWPQDIGALAILDGTILLDPAGELRIDAVHEAIASRLHLVPRFRQVIHVPGRGLGGPLWVDAPRFDIRDHVAVVTLPRGTGETGLLAVTEELRSQRFDPSRPLWRMWFMPGLPGGRVAMFVKLHHSIADGMAAMTTIAAFLDADPDASATPASPWTPAPAPTGRDLFIDNAQRHLKAVGRAGSMLVRPGAALRHARQAWPAVRELLARRAGHPDEPGPDGRSGPEPRRDPEQPR
jgi:diacylglycerol O-acyltransferase